MQDGVSSNNKKDGQAKSLGEYLRSKKLKFPKVLLEIYKMKQLSLEGLNFSTTEVNIKDKIMTITLDRPEKNAMNNVMIMS